MGVVKPLACFCLQSLLKTTTTGGRPEPPEEKPNRTSVAQVTKLSYKKKKRAVQFNHRRNFLKTIIQWMSCDAKLFFFFKQYTHILSGCCWFIFINAVHIRRHVGSNRLQNRVVLLRRIMDVFELFSWYCLVLILCITAQVVCLLFYLFYSSRPSGRVCSSPFCTFKGHLVPFHFIKSIFLSSFSHECVSLQRWKWFIEIRGETKSLKINGLHKRGILVWKLEDVVLY